MAVRKSPLLHVFVEERARERRTLSHPYKFDCTNFIDSYTITATHNKLAVFLCVDP